MRITIIKDMMCEWCYQTNSEQYWGKISQKNNNYNKKRVKAIDI